jgi:biotin-dependent carboxylase-like uncharacterized protein
MSLRVNESGVLSLLQDAGRRGWQHLGLSEGGPLDPEAFHYCNRLLSNPPGTTALEVSAGGLQLQAQVDTYICVTGARLPLAINDEERDLWEVHRVQAGDDISLGYASAGCRAYLGVAGGFEVSPAFGSPLRKGDVLPCAQVTRRRCLFLPEPERPRYQHQLTVRVIPGYQQRHFSRIEQRRFFGGPYTVTERCDRMGYRLEGTPVDCGIEGILSEGICQGAVQIPADGQPIVLLNDRQTIGGYPKIGAALSLDAGRMSQLVPGDTVHFAPITPHTARRTLELARRFTLRKPLRER